MCSYCCSYRGKPIFPKFRAEEEEEEEEEEENGEDKEGEETEEDHEEQNYEPKCGNRHTENSSKKGASFPGSIRTTLNCLGNPFANAWGDDEGRMSRITNVDSLHAGSRLLGATLFVSRHDDPQWESRAVTRMKHLASLLKGPCHKYPKKSKGFFRRSQSRFVAVQVDTTETHDAEVDPLDSIANWRNSYLTYWLSEEEYIKGEPPRGSLRLMSITKVMWEREHPTETIIRFMNNGGHEELRFIFPDDVKAENYTRNLYQLRALLKAAFQQTS